METTLIRISNDLKDYLERQGEYKDSMDNIIRRLLKVKVSKGGKDGNNNNK